jgi:hypothetical protein
VLGSAGKAFVSAMTGLQLRLRAAYAQRLLRALTGGTLGTHTGYSGFSQGVSEYSQGVLKGVCPQLRVRAARGTPSLNPADGAGPAPLTAPPRVRTYAHPMPLGSERTRTRTRTGDRRTHACPIRIFP